MALLILTAVLTIAAVLSGILAGVFPRVPSNYLSIAIGIVIAVVAPLDRLIAPFHSEIFMYIIVPLIYFEGQTTRLYFVRRWWRQIIETAVLLVVASLVIAGLAVSLLGIPLAIAFVLAAISTPTDATATETVSEGRIVPERQEKLLRMESLFNDASGIVLLEAMVLWLRGGHFQYQVAVLNFLRAAGGGVIVGIAIALLMISFRRGLRNFAGSTYNAQIMLFLITPFIIYFVAEKLGVSGIIAVVCAGLMQNSESSRSRFDHPRQYHNSLVLIDLVRDILNNLIFVVLGVMIVRIVRADLLVANNVDLRWLAAGFLIYLVTLAVRFAYGVLVKMGPRGSVIFALGGVHGAITLALVFSIAASLTDQQFQFVVLTETMLVLLSMLVPSVVFRFILQPDLSEGAIQDRVGQLRREMVREGIAAVDKIYLPDNIRASVLYDLRDQKGVTTMRDFWKQWSISNHNDEFTPEERDLERQALLWAFRAERNYLNMVAQREGLHQYLFELYNEVLLSESILIDPQSSLN